MGRTVIRGGVNKAIDDYTDYGYSGIVVKVRYYVVEKCFLRSAV
jgi:hypothetical protein